MLSNVGSQTIYRSRTCVGRLVTKEITRTKVSWVQRLSNIVVRLFIGTDKYDPKRVLERRYLYFGMIALRVREKRHDSNFSHLTMSELRQSAVDELDSEGIDNLSNGSLRGSFQEELAPQLLRILQSFLKVDKNLFGEQVMSEMDSQNPLRSVPHAPLDVLDLEYLKEILREEDTTALEDLANLQQQTDFNDGNDGKELKLQRLRKQYLQSKHAAIQILLDFHGIPVESNIRTLDSDDHELDIFGMERDSQVDVDLLRMYQTLNFCRSALIRRELGYSLLCLRSSLNKHAGRGGFVDGKCLMGDLVAFQPGEIWPAEFLSTDSPDVVEHFNDDVDECMTSLRFDDYLLDSRMSPVSVLTQAGSFNPWALGHMINHPDKGFWPNCQSLMVDFLDDLPEEVLRYVPNSFAREGTWKTNVFGNRARVIMPGLCLLARRDCFNEELYYDYRLQSSTDLPEWYSPVIYNDEFMDQQRTVFFGQNNNQQQEAE